MASLRFNYDGEKRMEQGRSVNCGNVYVVPPRPRMSRPIINRDVAPIPMEFSPKVEEAPETNTILEATRSLVLQENVVAEQEQQTAETPAEPTVNVSEKFIASLENYESGLGKILKQVDVGKGLFDEVLFYMDTFLKIMDAIKENEVRKQQEPQASVAGQKINKDTIDQVLDLLQTPTFQSILRQVLIGIVVKK